MAHLKLVSRDNCIQEKSTAAQSELSLAVGKSYAVKNISSALSASDGLIEDYCISIKTGRVRSVTEASESCFFWHSDVPADALSEVHWTDTQQSATDSFQARRIQNRIVANKAFLQSSKLIGPNIITTDNHQFLSITPEFIIHFDTSAGAAELGEIRLLDTSRFITLESGKSIPVVCTDPAEGQALFLHQDQTYPVIRQNFIQPEKTSESYVIRRSVNQELPVEIYGERVQSLTVLEHVTSCFLQKLSSDSNAIWTPTMQPVSWGWSIRAESTNNQWEITKRKVMRPTLHHNKLILPTWNTHVQEQSILQWSQCTQLQNPILHSSDMFRAIDFGD